MTELTLFWAQIAKANKIVDFIGFQFFIVLYLCKFENDFGQERQSGWEKPTILQGNNDRFECPSSSLRLFAYWVI